MADSGVFPQWQLWGWISGTAVPGKALMTFGGVVTHFYFRQDTQGASLLIRGLRIPSGTYEGVSM